MDPLSITTSATAILAICLQAVHLIQRTIETIKNAKKLLIKLLSQTERLRLVLEQLRSLTKQLGSRAGGLVLSYNDVGPKTTINDLNNLVRSIAGKTNFIGLQMLLNKNKVDALVERMKMHEEEIVTALISIASASAVRTENEILQIHDESRAQSEVLILFEDLFISTATSTQFKPVRTLPIWFGDTYQEGFTGEYLELREKLSNAAYQGNFEEVFDVLKLADEIYGECWVNAPRLGADPKITSGWSPLHQAAFMSAPSSVVQRLLELGASRTLRTNWSDPQEFDYTDLCAIEIAREHGYSHLFEVLAPVIRNAVPSLVLQKLQDRFHDIIGNDLAEFTNHEHLRLPQLSQLTEMLIPQMWFPLKALVDHSSKSPRGYLYYLDRRELVIKALRIRNAEDSRLYRISGEETHEIMEGVAFNSTANRALADL